MTVVLFRISREGAKAGPRGLGVVGADGVISGVTVLSPSDSCKGLGFGLVLVAWCERAPDCMPEGRVIAHGGGQGSSSLSVHRSVPGSFCADFLVATACVKRREWCSAAFLAHSQPAAHTQEQEELPGNELVIDLTVALLAYTSLHTL
jgi:hypothetical protein